MPGINETYFAYTEPTFYIFDYIVFSLFLCISGAVGIFFSCRGQKNTKEYFYGGNQMDSIPTGISTGLSFMSASAAVAVPAEMYMNGYSYIVGCASGSIGYLLGCMIVAYLLQPLGMTSVNEYISKRFRSKVLTYIANIIVLFCILQYMGTCMLGSVIAFNSVTGGKVSVILALTIGGVVGIFYTTIGGLKAVVWTDVIQSLVMFAGIMTVLVMTIIDSPGGMSEVIKINKEYGRIHEPIWSVDVTIRHTMWGLIIGFFVYWGIWSIQPACVQRLCSTKSRKDSYIVAVIAASLFFGFSFLPAWTGLNIFGYYTSRGCDVRAAGWIQNNDIILYYIRERLAYPGFQGLFMAALYAGSLSSLSSGLNSASAILWNDTIKPLLKTEVSEAKATFISKIIVAVFGVVSMLWCYILYSFGGMIIQVCATIDASMYGAYFGLFLLGVLFYYASPAGGIAGLVVSFAITLWLGLGSLFHGKHILPKLPSTTDHCAIINSSVLSNYSTAINSTSMTAISSQQIQNTPTSILDQIYSVSYVWLSSICIGVSLLVSLCVSGCLGGPKRRQMDNHYLVLPFCRPNYFNFCRRTGDDVSSESDVSQQFINKRNLEEL